MTRKPIFDAIKSARGGKAFDQMEVGAIDNLLDALDVPLEADQSADPFARALAEILLHEGGYVNHPSDPGGRTNLGVTQRVWEDWTGKGASEADMRSLTREMVAPLYRKNYWDAVRGDDLPPGVALAVFDMAVNAGPARAARILQQIVSVAADGKIGPQTLSAVGAYVGLHGEAALVKAYSEARRSYYRSLGTFGTFGKGWLRRVDATERTALSMAR